MSAQGGGDTPTTDPLRALELSIKESMITMNAAKHGQLTPVEMRKNETLQTMLNVVRAATAQTEQNSNTQPASNGQEFTESRSCAKGSGQVGTVNLATGAQVADTPNEQNAGPAVASPTPSELKSHAPSQEGAGAAAAGSVCTHPFQGLKYMGHGPLPETNKDCRWNYACASCGQWLKFDKPISNIGAKLKSTLPYKSEVMPTESRQDISTAVAPPVVAAAGDDLKKAMEWLRQITGIPPGTPWMPKSYTESILAHIAAQQAEIKRLDSAHADLFAKCIGHDQRD
jgi:hypothetical protein